jgi:hypothetical protein
MRIAKNPAKRLAHLQTIISCIEANAPEVATCSRGGNRYEGEEQFTVEYNNLTLECIRRMAMVDTSNLDYANGTGYSMDVIYDEIAVLSCYNKAGEDNEALVDELNEILC